MGSAALRFFNYYQMERFITFTLSILEKKIRTNDLDDIIVTFQRVSKVPVKADQP